MAARAALLIDRFSGRSGEHRARQQEEGELHAQTIICDFERSRQR
jgi:hypothetical protein